LINKLAGAAGEAAYPLFSVTRGTASNIRDNPEEREATVATKLQHQDPQRVIILAGEVHIDDFVETDPNVHRVLSEADEPEEAVHAFLRVGAQATLLARTDLETQVVERRFEDLARRFDSSLEGAVSRLTDMSSKLLDDEEGALPRIFEDVKTGIGAILDDTFDEDSKSSAIAKMDAVLEGAIKRLDSSVRASLDLDSPDSALAKTKREILETVKEQGHDLRKELHEVTLTLAAGKARSETLELTAIKGLSYEELLEIGVASIATIHGDVAERVGTRTGVVGTKSGDHLVTINVEDTCGQEARFVFECKDRRLSMSKTMDQLADAIENHAARAAIAVFSRQELAPTPLLFYPSGNRAVLVYDKDEPDDYALQLAYAWARWNCRRELTADGTALDVERIEAALARARQALTRHQSARSCFSAATKKIEEGAGHVVSLVDEVRGALAELWDELNK
jgi:hypothetical protein